MEKNIWKALAIIFLCLFILETSFVVWSVKLVAYQEERANTCFYEICKEYEEANYIDNLCRCYTWDLNLEEYVEMKVTTMYD